MEVPLTPRWRKRPARERDQNHLFIHFSILSGNKIILTSGTLRIT